MIILTTKLRLPRVRSQVITRDRLLAKLDAAVNRKLTLIAAPAGFGKTTLVCDWLTQNGYPFGWFSLDVSDNNLISFLFYLTSALQDVDANIGKSLISLLQSTNPPDIQHAAGILINDINAVDSKFILVLDDYHHLTDLKINNFVHFLIEHAPPQFHLLLLTRSDPTFPLSRLRVQEQVTEIRSVDLRFTRTEVTMFLNELMKLDLSVDDIALLEQRTEGWIASLQLAALSLQDRLDKSDFIRTFSGDHRYLIEYLVEEVISRQPDHIRHFLYQVSALDRFCAPLCDFMFQNSGQTINSQAMIDEIEQRNLFLISLDEKWGCYRFHHLFLEFLRQRLRMTQPEIMPQLYRCASEWYEHRYGRLGEAVRFALAAGDKDRADQLRENPIPLPDSSIEPLKPREMSILRCMAERLSNQEIADELHLSVSTIKWYASQIFDKLNVKNRKQAVRRARELGIL